MPAEAARRVSTQIVFTTHTPVPAGHDRFSRRAPRGAPRAAARSARPGSARASWRWGRVDPDDGDEEFCMTVLALKASRRANAVSSLHGRSVTRHVEAAVSRRRRGPGADRPHHQRRPRAHLAGAADASALRPPPRARLAASQRRSRVLGGHRPGRRRRAVGDAPDAEGAAHRDSRAGGPPAMRNGAASRPTSSASSGARCTSTR